MLGVLRLRTTDDSAVRLQAASLFLWTAIRHATRRVSSDDRVDASAFRSTWLAIAAEALCGVDAVAAARADSSDTSPTGDRHRALLGYLRASAGTCSHASAEQQQQQHVPCPHCADAHAILEALEPQSHQLGGAGGATATTRSLSVAAAYPIAVQAQLSMLHEPGEGEAGGLIVCEHTEGHGGGGGGGGSTVEGYAFDAPPPTCSTSGWLVLGGAAGRPRLPPLLLEAAESAMFDDAAVGAQGGGGGGAGGSLVDGSVNHPPSSQAAAACVIADVDPLPLPAPLSSSDVLKDAVAMGSDVLNDAVAMDEDAELVPAPAASATAADDGASDVDMQRQGGVGDTSSIRIIRAEEGVIVIGAAGDDAASSIQVQPPSSFSSPHGLTLLRPTLLRGRGRPLINQFLDDGDGGGSSTGEDDEQAGGGCSIRIPSALMRGGAAAAPSPSVMQVLLERLPRALEDLRRGFIAAADARKSSAVAGVSTEVNCLLDLVRASYADAAGAVDAAAAAIDSAVQRAEEVAAQHRIRMFLAGQGVEDAIGVILGDLVGIRDTTVPTPVPWEGGGEGGDAAGTHADGGSGVALDGGAGGVRPAIDPPAAKGPTRGAGCDEADGGGCGSEEDEPGTFTSPPLLSSASAAARGAPLAARSAGHSLLALIREAEAKLQPGRDAVDAALDAVEQAIVAAVAVPELLIDGV